jgi:hypothetical protein
MGFSFPATAMAFNIFEPITAPKPPDALAPSSASRVEKETLFSPAGPMARTLVPWPNSAFRVSHVSMAVLPQSEEASLISAVPLWTKR